jgi:Xaa-Pro aminopeptidase
MIDLDLARSHMRENNIDGWLLYDFRGSNPVFWRAFGETRLTTRRNFLYVPAEGEPTCLVHGIDNLLFADCTFAQEQYSTWQEMAESVKRLVGDGRRIAVEYSPGGAIPMHSFVDAGTVEWLRDLGFEVTSSADLYQTAVARWSNEALASHRKACETVVGIKDEAFDFIRNELASNNPLTEHQVQQFIQGRFRDEGLIWDHGPVVGVNENSGDPHYEPSADTPQPIRHGDWILIDLWAKYPGEQDVYCDITWTGFAGSRVPDRHQHIFEVVIAARDAGLGALQDAWKKGDMLQGWEVDDAARKVIADAGYAQYFTHRLGHSMGPAPHPHALGANLDNFETHDTRTLIPGTGFSIEPGIYLPEFGVRSEIDVFVDPDDGPISTTPLQTEVILLA